MVSKVEAAQRLLTLQEAGESFGAFCRLHHPAWKVPMFHHKLIEALDRLEKGQLLSDFNHHPHATQCHDQHATSSQ